jgi:hypothetical protein
MALATLADVRRILQLAPDDTSKDADLTQYLAAAESWFLARTTAQFSTMNGPKTFIAYDIREDARIQLPEKAASISSVTVSNRLWGTRTLGADEYEARDDGVRLRPTLGTTPFEGAVGERFPRWYTTVEVEYIPTTGVPAALRDAVATLAAVWYVEAGSTTGGAGTATVKRESIGDYSYELDISSSGSGSAGKERGIPAKVLSMFRPFLRRRISVT